ncbi:MAG: filamentous hemagglutinin N-terminal domain-containing protein [Verrucomicrobia bacterium]|nr:filamentous hemagglutinin N-terminal domain-containing protein [Verrucomicrobiota bacterium]
MTNLFGPSRRPGNRADTDVFTLLVLLALCRLVPLAQADPVGGTVTQGTASFTSQGSQFTITTSDRAAINWQSFNIGVGQTTTFVQPSSSSVVWNQINDPNPSQILGNLNANGYVILQNQAGFFIGGQAVLSARGLIMTTAPIPVPNLLSGGPWDFNAPPPTASIINYGQINVGPGGSAFLISHAIENHGTISAPAGQIGLYAGKDVLISERPDGRGLSAKVTLPEGSVDNTGRVIADAGTIAMHAQVVNQGGLVQANSVREVNGVIELVASENLSLGAESVLSAQGDATASSPSPGGFIVLKSDSAFTDNSTSTINVSGQGGGRDGVVEVFGGGTTPSTIQSRINDRSPADYLASGGWLLVNPMDITLSWDASTPDSSSPNLNVGDLSSFSKISLYANGSINLNTVWSLADSADLNAMLKLEAKNNITLADDGSGNFAGIQAGRNWNLNLLAGTELGSAANKQDGMDRIFLQGLSFLQTQNGNIDLTAGNEVFVDDGTRQDSQLPYDVSSRIGNGITTVAGGSINVAARYGDVNSGANPLAFSYLRNAPFYSVSTAPGELGGISTAAGGDVTISAGGNITSFMPGRGNTSDAGSGAFGQQPGNVTVTAAGNVFGHFVAANGVGTVTAGQSIGSLDVRRGFALSLVDGSWSVFAPNGSIYLQEVRNPNGVFNDRGGVGNFLFDYSPQASLLLEAGDSVEITGAGLPRGRNVAGSTAPPILLPPSLQIIAGAGGVKLDNNVALFPSGSGELGISTSGSFIGTTLPDGSRPTLLMSDSGSSQWTGPLSYTEGDHAGTPVELANAHPAVISVAGSMNNLILAMNKRAQITVGGDMINTAFSGQNLHAGDVTSINVVGKIYNRGLYTFTDLSAPITSVDWRNPTQWDSIFNLLVDPRAIANPDSSQDPSRAASAADLTAIAGRVLLFQSGGSAHNPGFVYDAANMRLGFAGAMTRSLRDALEGPLAILRIGPDGLPVVSNGHFVTDPVSFVPPSVIEALYTGSHDVPRGTSIAGYRIGGPGEFNITAGSLDLGNTEGIQSLGAARNPSLSGLTPSGAAVNVNLAGNLSMLTSRIMSLFGGNVTVYSGGSMDLGSQTLFGSSGYAFGIYTTGHSDVSVTAVGDINVNGSRIATYNGGNIFVESLEGNVNVGGGGTSYVSVPILRNDPVTGVPSISTAFIYGSGVVAVSLTKDLQSPGGNPLPGNIMIQTPQGNIVSATAGILQMPLDGNLAAGPTITLIAGTAPSGTSSGHVGNIDLGDSGVIGGAINMTAQGSIRGLIISRQNSTISAAQNFSGTLLSAGTANVNAGGTVSGTIAGIAGVNASGGQITASLMSQNVSVGGGQSQSTLGASATASTASQAASQQASSDTQKIAVADKDQDEKKKKKQELGRPVLARRVGRVTVILPRG